ncbi:hypothetical protein OC845_002140 [Tilletia horrida]|nr:hypothetical protein OC845_002140 [Tilletia horrida]
MAAPDPNNHPLHPVQVIVWFYLLYQRIVSFLFSPPVPDRQLRQKPLGHIAVIGAGVTGVSTAAHFVGHGFDVVLFEEATELGGIWGKKRVNKTSGLQLNSFMYRFFPTCLYTHSYPKRDEILDNLEQVWRRYGLDRKTRFNHKVTSVTRHKSSTDPKEGGHAKWIVDGNEAEIFDAVVATVGTCGAPNRMDLKGQDKFKGKIMHSSELDDVDLHGKRVIVVGGGASGIEALELAVEKQAKSAIILARSDKWIIPRSTVIDVVLALNPFGRQGLIMGPVAQFFLRKLHYRDLEDKMAPVNVPLFAGTPIVNNSALTHIRQGKADYQRGDLIEVSEHGVVFNKRSKYQKKGEDGERVEYDADVIVVATGFARPTLDFLPKDLFPEDYSPPSCYLQVFPVQDPSILLTNATYQNAIGTVGNWHIGIYARIAMVLLMDERCRPTPRNMRLWTDLVRFVKESSPAPGLTFFTYTELVIWLVGFIFVVPRRTRYFFFILFGYGFWSRAQSKIDKKGRALGEPSFHLSTSKLIPFRRERAPLSAQPANTIDKPHNNVD